MKTGIINEIKEVEKQAEDIRKDARTEAQSILADAREQSETLLRNLSAESRGKAAAAVSVIEAKTAAIIAEDKRAVEKECEAIISAAAAKKDETARYVLERIIS